MRAGIRRLLRIQRVLGRVYLLLLAVWLAGGFWFSACGLVTTRYTVYADIAAPGEAPLRIVQLTDLHSRTFGEDNRRLLEAVAAAEPDLIFVTGDMVNMDAADVSVSASLAASLAAIAPTYLSLGNHELVHSAAFGTDFAQIWEQGGAVLLDFSVETVTVRGMTVAVGGLYGYCTTPAEPAEEELLRTLCETEADVHLLLTHMPVCWSEGTAAEVWNAIDAVFCGHSHGGQIIWPLLGATFAPDQGWFPGKIWGLFDRENAAAVIVSRGLGGSTPVPRFNNIPELTVCEIMYREQEESDNDG